MTTATKTEKTFEVSYNSSRSTGMHSGHCARRSGPRCYSGLPVERCSGADGWPRWRLLLRKGFFGGRHHSERVNPGRKRRIHRERDMGQVDGTTWLHHVVRSRQGSRNRLTRNGASLQHGLCGFHPLTPTPAMDGPNLETETMTTATRTEKTFEVSYNSSRSMGMHSGHAQGEAVPDAIRAYLLSGVPVPMDGHDGGYYCGKVFSVDAIIPSESIRGGKGGYIVNVTWGKWTGQPGYTMWFDHGKEVETV